MVHLAAAMEVEKGDASAANHLLLHFRCEMLCPCRSRVCTVSPLAAGSFLVTAEKIADQMTG